MYNPNNLSDHTSNFDSDINLDTSSELFGSLQGTLLVSTSFLGLCSSIACYIHIKYLLRVNEINKLLLTIQGEVCHHFTE